MAGVTNRTVTINVSPGGVGTPGIFLQGAAHLFTATITVDETLVGRSVTFSSEDIDFMKLRDPQEESLSSLVADIKPDPSDPTNTKKGIAQVYGIMPRTVLAAIELKVTWNGDSGIAPVSQSYEVAEFRPVTAEYGEPMVPYIPVVPKGTAAPIVPYGNGGNTLAYTMEIHDLGIIAPATTPQYTLKSPVAIDVKETGVSVGLFKKVTAYDKNDSAMTTGDAIAPIYPADNDLYKDGFLRMQMTDADKGKKSIYLCATNSPVYSRISVILNRAKQGLLSPFFSYDLNGRVTYSMQAPIVNAVFGASGNLLLDRVVGYSIPVVPSERPTAFGADVPILLMQNDQPAGIDYWPTDAGQYLTMSVAKASILSLDDDPNSVNTLCYFAPSTTGVVSRSVSTEFKAIGSPGSNAPNQSLIRDLTAPGVLPPSSFITTETVRTPQVSFVIPKTQSAWTAQAGDEITMEVWLNGYYATSGAPKKGYLITNPPHTVTQDELDDATKNNSKVLRIDFESVDFLGYDSRKIPPPETFGRCAVCYTVVRKSAGNVVLTKYSQIFWPFIDTVPPGQTYSMFKKRMVL